MLEAFLDFAQILVNCDLVFMCAYLRCALFRQLLAERHQLLVHSYYYASIISLWYNDVIVDHVFSNNGRYFRVMCLPIASIGVVCLLCIVFLPTIEK